MFEKFFYRLESPFNINFFRCSYCLLLLVFYIYNFWLIQDLHHHASYNPVPSFEFLGIPKLGFDLTLVLHLLLYLFLLLSAIGIFTRPSLFLSSVLYFLCAGMYFGFTKAPNTHYVYHSENMIVWILLILAISPGVDKFKINEIFKNKDSKDLVPNYAAQVIIAVLGIAYFGSAYCKLDTAGLGWMDGYTMQAYLLRKNLLVDNNLALLLGSNYWICLALGIATIVFEISFFLITFIKKIRLPYVIAGLMFHTGIFIVMGINFLTNFCLVYLIFIHRKTQAAGKVIMPLGYKLFAGIFLFILTATVILRFDFWPFSDYRVYEHQFHIKYLRVFRIIGVDKNNAIVWFPEGTFAERTEAVDAKMRAARDSEKEEAERIVQDAKPQILKSNKYKDAISKVMLVKVRFTQDENGKYLRQIAPLAEASLDGT